MALISSQKIGSMINKWQFCAVELAKSANYPIGACLGDKKVENYARNDKLNKN